MIARHELKTILAITAFVILGFLSLSSSPAAQSGPGVAIAEFLNTDPGARAGSMAGAASGINGGLAGVHYNPSSLTGLRGFSVALHHANWYQSTFHEQASAGLPLGRNTAIAVSFSYLHYGSVDGYDADNQATGEFSPSDAVFSVGAAQKLGDFLSVGLSGKYFQEKLGTQSFSGWAVDLGAQYRRGAWSLGVSALNVGPDIRTGEREFPLPRRMRVGAGYFINGQLLLGTDLELLGDGTNSLRHGLEYNFMPGVWFRGGYRSQADHQGDESSGSWTTGVGLLINHLRVDYNYLPGGVLGDIHRFSVSFGK